MMVRNAALIAVAALSLGACDDDNDPMAIPQEESIATVAIDGGFTQLVAALQHVDQAPTSAGLVNLFSADNSGPFTVFAPTDAAFTKLYGTLTTVLGTQITNINQVPRDVVLAVLKYHVVAGEKASTEVLPKTGSQSVGTLLGESFSVTAAGKIQDGLGTAPRATIVQADVKATNGVVHVIDEVILPPSVVQALTGGN